jgi:hypothetical protein
LFVYWGIFLILAAGAMLNQDRGAVRARFAFILVAALPMILMIGLRWKIGPDWAAYLDQFNYTKLYSLNQALTHAEPGYFTLNWVVHQFDGAFWALNFICGIVFVAGLTAFCRRQPNPWLACIVAFPYLVVVVAMSGNRQSLALGFLFFALNAFERRQLNRFLLFAIVAALFHGSVLLIVPLCLLSYSRNGLQRALLLLTAGLLAYYFFQDVFSIYARRYSSEKIQSTGVAYRLAMNGLSAVIFLLFRRQFGFDDHERSLWRNISIVTLALVAVVVILPSSTAVDRFLLYLFPLQFVVLSRIPTVLSHSRQSAGQLTLLVICYAAAVQVIFLQFGTFASYYLPYRSIFSG